MMYKINSLLVGLIGFLGLSSAQISQFQSCSSINLMNDFVLESFLGTWYEVGKASSQNADCSSLTFTQTTYTNSSVVNNFLQSVTGTVTQTLSTPQLTLSPSSAAASDFSILSTDYSNYAIAINCVDVSETQRTINVWQLGRTASSYDNAATLQLANTALATIGLTVSQLQSIDHSADACTVLPVIGNGQPVILDGQCSTTLNAVQNFQVASFTGTWYEISSYYSANAVGTCARADYTLVGSTVNVVNSQVLNQRLDTISGTATVASTDGSGRLNVTLNVQGFNIAQELYVLDTDYSGYAVSYTCVNIGTSQRQVNSWILSRTQQITAASQTEVDRVIASFLDLNTEYFEDTLQTDEACFYFPDAVVGRPVIFLGQCDTSVNAISGFNLTTFAGTWYEVEAYPKEQQTGTCVNHLFSTTTTANTLDLVSNQVVNQAVTSASGSVVVASTDGSGRLQLTMVVNGLTITFPYWVLATDYSTYALVYSCINRDDNTRSVHSWKLSRTQTLPAAAVTAINTAMIPVQVLQNEYFETIDQSAAGCFAYPEIPAGNPIILDGLCESVTPIANFQVADFVGTWHEISSYFSESAVGTCARADYTLVGSTVNVVNSQVLNQRLDTINGNATLVGTDGSGRLSVILDVQGVLITQELLILDTNYNGYAVSYSCVNVGTNQRRVFSWVLSRTQQISAASQTEVNRVIDSFLDLNSQYFQATPQTADACFYFPEAIPGTPVVFPGQCDDSVNALNGFNMASFIGTWHEVEAYPKEQQTGTCVNHAFTAGTSANTLDLVSNQVVNQQATSSSGSVVYESIDGSARLNLTMVVNGQTITFPYWILATDYTSYAVAYSCINITTNSRSVHSWKLSRTQTLPAAAVTAINNAMIPVQVLENEYFETIDQSAAGCIAYPEIPAGNPIILDGLCESVTPIANFQVADFVGTWHEISSYFSESAVGTCARADYTLVGSTVNVVNSQVLNQRLDTINGNATLVGTDGSGRLSVVLDVQGVLITQELLILDTNYNGYAVSYSCVNVGTNQRRVFSWVLSRTQQISAASQTEVNRVIDSFLDLNSQYFQATPQTADACFYFPEAIPGTPVVFPGQCDDSVNALNGFNMASFIGTWHEVEAYPKEQQTGTCVNHAFTAGTSANTLDLVSNQVVNQQATSSSGSVVYESTDGSARLNLTMVVNGQTITFPYWILATDYTSYALAYSCINITTNSRSVHSWKLSRTQTLPAAAVTAINNAMIPVQVLENEYFETIDQSAAGCIAYPEIPAGNPIILDGLCESVTPIANFQVADFVGTWHEISSYFSESAVGTCARADYTLVGSTVNVVNSQVLNQRLDTINGNATLVGTDGSGRLSVVLDVQGVLITQELLILDTNYNGYAVSYSCVNVGTNQRRVYSWVLSRTQQISATSQTEVNRVIDSFLDLNSQYFQATPQTADACFYFPEAIPGTPVVFPGQCDDSVNALSGFNMASFIGTWHEVEAYPKEQQTGTCVNHAFTAGTSANTLDLVSNQVVNQQATSSSGSVVYESTDGSARLNLTMVVNGQTITFPYWILATDYTSYALAYSCINITTNSRSVHSWKLSRTQTLPAAAVTAINTAMIPVQVLENEYFETIDQSAAGCFAYPEVPAGNPIILDGLCDSVTPIANFQVAEFVGTWHEISSYFSESAVGTCARADYTLVGSTVNVVNSQVLNQRLDTINGNATLVGTDGSGRLSVILDVQGVLITQELLILDTNYNGYAVSYSCVNVGTNQRRVYSWVLSRTQQISAASQTEVNRVIDSFLDLNSQYFQATPQTADACFYFPEAIPGTPVVFPGQCDDSVNALSGFNMASFIGTWHEVEAYPKEQQTGTCVNHAFTAGTNANTLNLVSNQVVNQQATSSSGSVVYESTDGSARLNLTMVVNGQTITFPYWILATDYTSYALAYSCINISTNSRSVHSWKLSRTQTLPAAAVTAINTAMIPVQVLENEYFETIDQSAAGCFVFPEIPAGNPIILDGLCESVTPIANFQVAEFVGTWHEISSYFSESAVGTCARADYALVGSTVNVVNSQVINQRLDTINGNATLVGTDGSGRLSVVLDVQGVLITQELLILDTNYNGYAVSYSCVNVGTNQRRVYSWVLSRTQQISAASQTEVNRVIDSFLDLNSQYFQATPQTADACFYFPEAIPGTPVVFPGQCDDSVNALSGFNMASFIGIWHEVEAYPKEDQTGTCVNHAFTSGTTANTLNLVSNQVVNQQATSSSGSVVYESTDGSARLTLTMVVNGQTITFPYWILATDYTSYALVYSCINTTTNSRSVHSWKLSRTQTLTAAAVTAINTAMLPVQVLENEYFEPIGQSEAECLAYPDIPAGEPIVLQGQCGTVTPVTNFQAASFVGTWYETARYASERQSGSCAAQEFTTAAQNSFNLSQTIIYNERLTNVFGQAILATDGSGVLTATLSDGAGLSYNSTIYILDTDYSDFALLYSCENLEGTTNRQIFSWKLSRSQAGLTQEANDRIAQVIANNVDLLEQYYQPTGQTSNDCFYYPVFEEIPEFINLPGACPAITGKANFNPAQYLGLWHDVASYPIASQNGTCSRAEYYLVDGVITIRNTMVVDGQLRTQMGIARLSSTGTGLLQVTFILENGLEVETLYYILETDYTSYSLVYNCRNQPDGTRQVFSWKLSRTPTLTAEANAAINNVINNTQGLLEEYYLSTSQSAEDCFYVPEFVPGQSVLFRGVCEAVTGMQGFNTSQYLGWWHEIERYPSDVAPGQCTSANFLQNGNNIQVVETSVEGGVGSENIRDVVIAAADGTITINREEGPTVWTVLDTDYSSYSLLYSCENVVTTLGTYRRVWSAKHSKARSLTQAAHNALNLTIASNDLLHNHLYENVDQTDLACFHYREEAGEQVIMSGQCDTGIPVQGNFDISQFAGTWYQLERYPYPQVSNEGTCVGASYTVNGNNVNVQNWEVLDGALNTIEGSATVDAATATLTVTLPVADSEETTNMNLRILATDYNDYALAYTCVNVNEFQRAVGAFKLSRRRQLSNEGQYAIETYMANRQELHQPFFITVEQNDQCLEPSSALLAKSSIIIMLVSMALHLVM